MAGKLLPFPSASFPLAPRRPEPAPSPALLSALHLDAAAAGERARAALRAKDAIEKRIREVEAKLNGGAA